MDYKALGFPRTEYNAPIYPAGILFEFTVRYIRLTNHEVVGYGLTKTKPARYQPCQENPKCQTS